MHIEKFLDKQFRAIAGLSLADFEINPFLIAAIKNQLNMSTPHDLANWMVRQRLERSMVTGFGLTLQSIAKEFSNEKPLPKFTARISRGGSTYNLIVKSGPRHNLAVTQTIQSTLLLSKKSEPDSIPIFGMCYGNNDTVGGIVRKHADQVEQLVGREFWAFISGHPDCHHTILTLAADVGGHYTNQDGYTLANMAERKIAHIEGELKKSYGDSPAHFWKGVLDDA